MALTDKQQLIADSALRAIMDSFRWGAATMAACRHCAMN
jgi:hypothetical protein